MASMEPRVVLGVTQAAISRPRPRARRRLWRTLARGSGLFNIAFLLLLVIAAVFAPALTHYDPTTSDVTRRLLPPAWVGGGSRAHLLGTDQLGRDVFARLIYGSRISLIVGTTTVAISSVLGSGLGLLAGY